MFTSSRTPSHDRQGRRSNIRKNAPSSRLSLFSGFTTTSGGSSGGGSTIAQEPGPRSRRAARASASLRQNKEQAAPLATARRQSTGSSITETSPSAINVFAFLEHDPSEPFATDPDASVQDAAQHVHDCTTLPEESDIESSARSLHSDSGISIRDSSPESLHYRSHSRSVLDPLREEDSIFAVRRSPFKTQHHHSKMRPERYTDTNGGFEPHSPHDPYLDGDPETFYRDHNHSSSLIAPASLQAPMQDPLSDLSGYDLLAARLTDSHNVKRPLRPLYRKFTRLNHRILLQLQDEISQMEQDLAGLDAADIRFRRGSTGQIAPESRRSNWQWHGSELHGRRLDLLGQIYVKVEQYNQALSAFKNVMEGTPSASESDVHHYRSWMKQNAPIAEVEQRFLDEPEDLLAFCGHKSCPTCEGHASLAPGFVKVIIMGLVTVTALFTVSLFVLSPRMGILLIITIAVVLYVNRNEVTDVVAECLHS